MKMFKNVEVRSTYEWITEINRFMWNDSFQNHRKPNQHQLCDKDSYEIVGEQFLSKWYWKTKIHKEIRTCIAKSFMSMRWNIFFCRRCCIRIVYPEKILLHTYYYICCNIMQWGPQNERLFLFNKSFFKCYIHFLCILYSI